MESKLRGITVLFIFVFATVVIFLAERKFLLANIDPNIEDYADIPHADRIKYIINDFEKYSDGQSDFMRKKLFPFGSAIPEVTHRELKGGPFIQNGILKVKWDHAYAYGGWGQRLSKVMELNADKDFLNLYVYVPEQNSYNDSIRILMDEDDNKNGSIEKELDDSWRYDFKVEKKNSWQLVSIPLKDLVDNNPMQGDGQFNVSEKDGKLITFVVSMLHGEHYTNDDKWYFDFVCFSEGPLNGEESSGVEKINKN